MSPLPVVEGLDVVEESGSSRGPGGPGGIVDEFDLEGGEEALGDGVVPTVPRRLMLQTMPWRSRVRR